VCLGLSCRRAERVIPEVRVAIVHSVVGMAGSALAEVTFSSGVTFVRMC
jgi:hypothetical protein